MDVGIGVRPTASVVPLLYRIYGLTMASDVPLPIAPLDSAIPTLCDVRVRRMPDSAFPPSPQGEPVASIVCERHQTVSAMRYVGADGTWLINPRIAFRIAPDGRLVDVFAAPFADDFQIALLLLGQVAIFVLRALGHNVLHASAIVVEGGAIAFLGEPGAGKSSIAAGFLRRGATLLTDDALPIERDGDGVLARPSLGLMKLWPQAVSGALALCDDLPRLISGVEKRLLNLEIGFTMAQEPVPLRALYVLKRYSPIAESHAEVAFRKLSVRETVAMLIAQTSWLGLLAPHELVASLPAFEHLGRAVAVREIRYPSGFDRQDTVQTAILEDLAQS